MKIGVYLGGVPLRVISGSSLTVHQDQKLSRIMGLSFISRVGLAAGFDKNAEILEALPDLGFGFAEVGTVTPRPQPGHPRPRLFRYPKDQSLFNRMGFNNLGSSVIAARLSRAKWRLPSHFRIGINVGKNADTPIENAAEDYGKAVIPFEGLADYFVINISSPNTIGLRSLQNCEAIKPIIDEVVSRVLKWNSKPPVLLKIAPELTGSALKNLIETSEALGIHGWILTNTLAGVWQPRKGQPLSGGWSGGRLSETSYSRLKELRAITLLPIISVGGILSVAEAQKRDRAGAQLVQLYTGWIMNGPTFPLEVAKSLEARQEPGFCQD